MSFALSKSTKRRRCLEEIEELGLAIDSNTSCNNHNSNDQPSSSKQHISAYIVILLLFFLQVMIIKTLIQT